MSLHFVEKKQEYYDFWFACRTEKYYYVIRKLSGTYRCAVTIIENKTNKFVLVKRAKKEKEAFDIANKFHSDNERSIHNNFMEDL